MIAFERATELAARQLASFRLGLDCDDPYAYTENEKLMAGHIVGNLAANNLLNESGEKWKTIETIYWSRGLNTISRFVHDRFGF